MSSSRVEPVDVLVLVLLLGWGGYLIRSLPEESVPSVREVPRRQLPGGIMCPVDDDDALLRELYDDSNVG